MLLVYIVFVVCVINTIRECIQSLKEKDMMQLMISIGFFLFMLALFLGMISGGSAIRDIQAVEEFHRTGHYYLTNGGVRTEVSYERFMIVYISEIVGFSAFTLCFFLGIMRDRKKKKPSPLLMGRK